MKFFIKLKTWQLFLLIMLFPLAGLAARVYAATGAEANYTFDSISIACTALAITLLMAWLYTLGILLHKKLSFREQVPALYFKLAVLYTLLYMVILPFILPAIAHYFALFVLLHLLLPFHLLAVCCILYMLYFVSRILVSVEKQQIVSWSEFSNTFFLIFFFPIGVWWIQPRVHRLFA